MDDLTDVSNIDNEPLLVVWFDKEGVGEQVSVWRWSFSGISRHFTESGDFL